MGDSATKPHRIRITLELPVDGRVVAVSDEQVCSRDVKPLLSCSQIWHGDEKVTSPRAAEVLGTFLQRDGIYALGIAAFILTVTGDTKSYLQRIPTLNRSSEHLFERLSTRLRNNQRRLSPLPPPKIGRPHCLLTEQPPPTCRKRLCHFPRYRPQSLANLRLAQQGNDVPVALHGCSPHTVKDSV